MKMYNRYQCALETLRIMKEYRERYDVSYDIKTIATCKQVMKEAMESIGVFEEQVLVAIDDYFTPITNDPDKYEKIYSYLENRINPFKENIKPVNNVYSKSEIMCTRLMCIRTVGPYMNREVSKLLGKETCRCFETDTKRDLIAYNIQDMSIKLLESPDLTEAVNIYRDLMNILYKKGRDC